MKVLHEIAVCGLAVVLTGSPAAGGEWVKSREGARIWSETAEPGWTCSWSGRRGEGNDAEGSGLLVWFKDDRPVAAVSVVMVSGRQSGTAVTIRADGSRLTVDSKNRPSHGNLVGTWEAHDDPENDANPVFRQYRTIVFHGDGTFQRIRPTRKGTLLWPRPYVYEGTWKWANAGKTIEAVITSEQVKREERFELNDTNLTERLGREEQHFMRRSGSALKRH